MSAKKQLLRSKRLHLADVIDEYGKTYKIIRNKYESNIKKCKKETLQRFVETEGNRDPWEIVYRIVKEKIGKPIIWTALMLPDGSRTTCLDDTIEVLLRKCVPEGNTTELSEASRALKKKVECYSNMNLEPIISFNEIKTAMSKFRNKKAQGMDNFKIEIVKKLWRKVPEAIHILMNNCFNQRIFPRQWKEFKDYFKR